MASLYRWNYVGAQSSAAGALYVGNGTLAGFDIYGRRYKGTYKESGNRFKGEATLSVPEGGQFIAGMQLTPGTTIEVSVDWPLDFGGGKPLTVTIAGQPVQVVLHKMVDF